MIRRFALPLMLGPAVLLAACSDDGTSGSIGGTPRAEGADLAARLPAATTTAAFVDLDAARDQLGLPPDTSVDDIDFENEPERLRLLSVASLGLPYLARPQDAPLTSALDTGAVHAAASTGGGFSTDHGAAVVRTDQKYADLAATLIDAGYEESGDYVVSDLPVSDVGFPVVADGGDGTIVLAQSKSAAQSVLDGDAGSSAAVDLLDRLSGIAVAASTLPDEAESGFGVGLGIDLEPAAGEIVIAPGDDPDPACALPDPDASPVLASLDLEDGSVDGDAVRIGFTYDTERPLQTPVQLVFSDFPAGSLYEC